MAGIQFTCSCRAIGNGPPVSGPTATSWTTKPTSTASARATSTVQRLISATWRRGMNWRTSAPAAGSSRMVVSQG